MSDAQVAELARRVLEAPGDGEAWAELEAASARAGTEPPYAATEARLRWAVGLACDENLIEDVRLLVRDVAERESLVEATRARPAVNLVERRLAEHLGDDRLANVLASAPAEGQVGQLAATLHAIAVERLVQHGRPPARAFDMWKEAGFTAGEGTGRTPTGAQARAFALAVLPKRGRTRRTPERPLVDRAGRPVQWIVLVLAATENAGPTDVVVAQPPRLDPSTRSVPIDQDWLLLAASRHAAASVRLGPEAARRFAGIPEGRKGPQ